MEVRALYFYLLPVGISFSISIFGETTFDIHYHLRPHDEGYEIEGIEDDGMDSLEVAPIHYSETLGSYEDVHHRYAIGWPSDHDSKRYIEFSIAPKSGYALSLNNLKFNLYSEADGFTKIKGPRYWSLDVMFDAPDLPVNFWVNLLETIGIPIGQWLYATDYSERIYQQDMCNCQSVLNLCICHPVILGGEANLTKLKNFKSIMPGQKVTIRLSGYGGKIEGKGGFQGNAVILQGGLNEIEDCPVPKGIPSREGAKTIAYLLDGTWGHEEGGHDFKQPSNIAKLFSTLNGKDLAAVIYFRGIGNSKDHQGDLYDLKDYLGKGNYNQIGVGATGIGANYLSEKIYSIITDRYNEGYTNIILVGWSRGAAIMMQVANLLYHKGIPVRSWAGGSHVGGHEDCILIEQMHLIDTVHSLGLPNTDLASGWYDDVLPPNIRRAWHYLADTENPPTGFRQTRPINAIELFPCKDLFDEVSHGDVGGSTGSECSNIVFEAMKDHLSSGKNEYFTKNKTHHIVKKQIYSSSGTLLK